MHDPRPADHTLEAPVKTRVAKLMLGLGFTILVGIAFLSLPFSPNLGLLFGYYGEFNDVRRAIEEETSLEIIDVSMHKDLNLEDYWITVRTVAGRVFTLGIVDGGRIRKPTDRGSGVLIIGHKPRTTRVFATADTAFWKGIMESPPASIEELLPRMDAFLGAVDASIFRLEDLPWEASREYIHVYYESPDAAGPADRLLPTVEELNLPPAEQRH